MIAPGILSPAEAIAASLCWLSTMKPGKTLGKEAADQVDGYWHRGACRFCDVDRPELMRQITSSQGDPRYADAIKAFEKLARPARAARVREAMELPWYDEVTKE